jgi:hypothetical protein
VCGIDRRPVAESVDLFEQQDAGFAFRQVELGNVIVVTGTARDLVGGRDGECAQRRVERGNLVRRAANEARGSAQVEDRGKARRRRSRELRWQLVDATGHRLRNDGFGRRTEQNVDQR